MWQFQHHRQLPRRMTRRQHDTETRADVTILIQNDILPVRPFKGLHATPVKRARQSAFSRCNQHRRLCEISDTANMVNMCMGLDHQINRIRFNTAAGKLGFGQIIRPANQYLAKFIKAVFSAGSPKVLRIFAGNPLSISTYSPALVPIR